MTLYHSYPVVVKPERAIGIMLLKMHPKLPKLTTMNQMTPAKSRYDCLLWGGYGFGNTGDELTLALALDEQRQQPGTRVAILSRNPARARALFPGVPVIPYNPYPVPLFRRMLSRVPALRNVMSRLAERRPQDREQRCLPAPAINTPDAIDSSCELNTQPWTGAVASSRRLHLVGGGYL